jgi:hypothetical protein
VSAKNQAEIVLEPGIVEVDPNQAAALLHCDLNFPLYERGLGECVLADQKRIGIRSPDFVPADSLDVILVFGVDRFIELKVSKVEIDMLVFFPCAHEMVVLNVCAAEAHERTWKCHVSDGILARHTKGL